MTVTKTHIAIGFTIFSLIGLTLLGIYWYQRRRNKTNGDLKTLVDINTKPINSATPLPLPGTPSMYGAQKVYKDPKGVWRIYPGVCELVQTGIVDWDKINAMPQLEKDTLYADLGTCKMSNLPLIQPV